MKNILYWLCWNSILYSAIYFGIIKHDNEGATNIALFLVWFANIASFGLLLDPVIQNYVKRPKNKLYIPAWIDVTIDLVGLFVLVYNGYIVTGAFWLAHILNCLTFRNKVKTAREKTL